MEKETWAYAGGRRPVLLALNPDGAYALGVNVEWNEISVAVVDFLARCKVRAGHFQNRFKFIGSNPLNKGKQLGTSKNWSWNKLPAP